MYPGRFFSFTLFLYISTHLLLYCLFCSLQYTQFLSIFVVAATAPQLRTAATTSAEVGWDLFWGYYFDTIYASIKLLSCLITQRLLCFFMSAFNYVLFYTMSMVSYLFSNLFSKRITSNNNRDTVSSFFYPLQN